MRAPTMDTFTIARALLPLVVLSALLLPMTGCGSASTTSRAGQPTATTTTRGTPDSTLRAMLEAMRRLEREPLAAGAGELRRRTFAWIATAPQISGIDLDASYVSELERGTYPFQGEMMMQFFF